MTSLTNPQITRYSRQLLLKDGFGPPGQLKLLSSTVTVVGAGGLASTVLLYLAGAGVKSIHIVDFDIVDVSNLHRQIIHTTMASGKSKAQSAKTAVLALNPEIEVTLHEVQLSHENALSILSPASVVVDASDNPKTRYLISDACCLLKKPLVSGSAMGTEGQLTVYNYDDGPCYRCLYPNPDKAGSCKSCSDNGVLGPVPGLIGTLQATECIKIITGVGEVMSRKLLMYSALHCDNMFKTFKLPGKRELCAACGSGSSFTIEQSKILCEGMRGPTGAGAGAGAGAGTGTGTGTGTGGSSNTTIGDDEISCSSYATNFALKPHILIDVRPRTQFSLCKLENAINIPLDELSANDVENDGLLPIVFLCKRGISSLKAVAILRERRGGLTTPIIVSMHGGLEQWKVEVDQDFPTY